MRPFETHLFKGWMWIWHFWVTFVLSVLVTLWSIVKYENSSLVHHTSPTHRCDVERHCQPDERGNFDTSWICCEDSGGWPISHTLAPMTLMLLSNDYWFTLALDLVWECIEASEMSLSNELIFASDKDKFADYETTAGSLIADVIACGFVGIEIAILLVNYTGWRGLSGRTPRSGHRIAWKYWLGAIVSMGVWLFPNIMSKHNVNSGLIVSIVLSALIITFMWTWILQPDDVVEGDSDPQAEFRSLRWWWLFVTLFIGVTGFGYIYFYNVFYQLWLNAYFVIFLLLFLLYAWPILVKTKHEKEKVDDEM
jgi:hypothetical protein